MLERKIIPDDSVVDAFLCYARRVVQRGYVHSQLGNIAIRVRHEDYPEHGVCYTKHRGVSLEQATKENIIITEIPSRKLLYGLVEASIGHQLNTEVFRHRPDVNAVVHVHVDEAIAFFATTRLREFRFVSPNTAPILGMPPHILPPEENVELDAARIGTFIGATNAFIMPNHGITTLGPDLSSAYHRLNALVAEIRRVIQSVIISRSLDVSVPYLSDAEVEPLYALSRSIGLETTNDPQ
jgi:ribulose-5-phosphate 4-epimerase/fuculose-1-phosphate aldolase